METIIISLDLFSAINNLCTGSEGKILMSIIGGCSSTKDMLKMTGITKPNHYFAIRKKLIDREYITLNPLRVNSDKILNDYILTN